jgi:amino acid transporter
MTIILLLKVLSVLLTVAWVPLLVRFYRRWRDRRHPVSLAIASAILLFCFINICVFWAFDAMIPTERIVAIIRTGEAIVCAHFYLAFWSGDRRERRLSGDYPKVDTKVNSSMEDSHG